MPPFILLLTALFTVFQEQGLHQHRKGDKVEASGQGGQILSCLFLTESTLF